MNTLSPMRRAILEFINEFTDSYGYPPSMREICAGVGLKSPSTVYSHLNVLKNEGYLTADNGKNRTVKVSSDACPVLKPARRDDMVSIPILGRVAAGTPILAQQETEGYIAFDDRPGTYFALRVRGDSMVNAGILDGDTIIVREQPTADNGEIVVALLGEEATVKRLMRRGGHVTLLPENELYDPIPADDAVLIGRVVEVRREY